MLLFYRKKAILIVLKTLQCIWSRLYSLYDDIKINSDNSRGMHKKYFLIQEYNQFFIANKFNVVLIIKNISISS